MRRRFNRRSKRSFKPRGRSNFRKARRISRYGSSRGGIRL